MCNTLKRILMQSIRVMDYDFMCLDLSVRSTTSQGFHHIEALGTHIEQLSITLGGLPLSHDLFNKVVRHEIRQQISMISTRTQLLQLKYKDRLEADSLSYLDKILTECDRMIQTLDNRSVLMAASV